MNRICLSVCASVVLLLVLARAPRADEIEVEVPDDPFIGELPELAALERDYAMLEKEAVAAARDIHAFGMARVRVRVLEINESARAHRREALALVERIDRLKTDLSAWDEEKTRFKQTCAAPATKEAEASCRAWAERLKARRNEVRTRRSRLADEARRLEAALQSGLLEPLGRLRGEIGHLHDAIGRAREAARKERDAPAKEVGQIGAIAGDVYIKVGAGWERVTSGTVIREADEILTGRDGRAELILRGATFVLGAGSEMVLADPSKPEGLWAQFKKGIFRLRTRLGQDRAAIRGRVTIKNAVAAVRGTDYIAEVTDSGDTVLTVLEGSVVFTPADGGPDIRIDASYRLDVGADGTPGSVSRIDVAAVEKVWSAVAGSLTETVDTVEGRPFPVLLLAVGGVLLVLIVLSFALRRGGP